VLEHEVKIEKPTQTAKFEHINYVRSFVSNYITKLTNKSIKRNDIIMEIYLEYLRKSREDLDYEKNNIEFKTLERHKERLKLIADSSNKHVDESNIYEEVVSGDSISERPQIQKLLRRIEDSSIKGVWVIDVQRLCRGDLGDQDKIIKTFKYTNTLILTPEKEYDLSNPADEEYLIDKLSYSRKEYNNIKKRLVEGRKDGVRSGCVVNSIAPFGYERYKLKGQKGFSLKIVEEQAKIVRLIFKICLDGKGTFEIASYLNSLGIKSPKNSIWQKNGIREMLHNETYIGKVMYGKRQQVKIMENGILKTKTIRKKDYKTFDAKHEAIISKEDFELVQKKLKACSTKYVKPEKELKNPLAGILYCSECNHVMARRGNEKTSYQLRKSKEKIYYESKDIIYCAQKCKTVSHTLEYVEQLLISSLSEWLVQNKKIIKEYEQDQFSIVNDITNTIDLLNQNLLKEKQKLERLREFLEDGIYDKKTYLERSKIIENSISSIKEQITKINQENKEIKMKKIKSLIPKVEYCINQYFNMNTKEKNEILHSILEKVVYTKHHAKSKSDLTLDLYMKI